RSDGRGRCHSPVRRRDRGGEADVDLAPASAARTRQQIAGRVGSGCDRSRLSQALPDDRTAAAGGGCVVSGGRVRAAVRRRGGDGGGRGVVVSQGTGGGR